MYNCPSKYTAAAGFQAGEFEVCDSDLMTVPGIYVDRIVKATEPKAIEVIALAKDPKEQEKELDPKAAALAASKDWRHRIARRAAREIHDGFYVNLGVGIPTLVPEHLDPNVKVWLESENGILGMGPYPTKDQVDPYVSSDIPFVI